MSDALLPFPWFDLVLILALVALNGVLSMSELAIVSSREARLRAMAKSGSRGAKAALGRAASAGRRFGARAAVAGDGQVRQPRRQGRARPRGRSGALPVDGPDRNNPHR